MNEGDEEAREAGEGPTKRVKHSHHHEDDEKEEKTPKSLLARNLQRILFTNEIPHRNELFSEGRMAYVVELDDEASDVPTTLLRSLHDCPVTDSNATVNANNMLISKLTQVFSYLRTDMKTGKARQVKEEFVTEEDDRSDKRDDRHKDERGGGDRRKEDTKSKEEKERDRKRADDKEREELRKRFDEQNRLDGKLAKRKRDTEGYDECYPDGLEMSGFGEDSDEEEEEGPASKKGRSAWGDDDKEKFSKTSRNTAVKAPYQFNANCIAGVAIAEAFGRFSTEKIVKIAEAIGRNKALSIFEKAKKLVQDGQATAVHLELGGMFELLFESDESIHRHVKNSIYDRHTPQQIVKNAKEIETKLQTLHQESSAKKEFLDEYPHYVEKYETNLRKAHGYLEMKGQCQDAAHEPPVPLDVILHYEIFEEKLAEFPVQWQRMLLSGLCPHPDQILGSNIRPMLLETLPRLTDWWEPIAAHSGTEFFVEMMYGGEHVLLHKIDKDNYKYYTRNGMDFSRDYGSSSTEGSISNRIHSFFLDSCVDCVLDVKLMMYDTNAKKLCRHNTADSSGKTHSFRSIRPELGYHMVLVVVVFDILHYNGRSLLNVPLEERFKVLEKGVLKKQAEDSIYIAKRQIMSSRSEVEEFFSAAMKNDEEGIVVKSMTSLYIPGSRAKTNGWFKLKPNLASSCSIDLAVVAILPHQGQNNKDEYLLAAREEHSSKMRIVGKVSIGLSDLDRKRIYEDATRAARLTDEPHESIRGNGKKIEGKGGFIHPHHMNVVEVTCIGIRDMKLVDPVVRCIREKPVDEIDSLAGFHELREMLLQFHGDQESVTERERDANALDGKLVYIIEDLYCNKRERVLKILDKFGAKHCSFKESSNLIVAQSRTDLRTSAISKMNKCGILT